MKKIKLTLASFLALLLSAAVSMESPANNFAPKETKKLLLSQMFKIAKEMTYLDPEEREERYQLETLMVYWMSITDQETPAFIRNMTSKLFHAFYWNMLSILDNVENNLTSSEQVAQLKPLFPELPKSIFSLYLIPALKRGEKGIVEALMKAGANFHKLKCIAQENKEDDFINTLINDYQSKQKEQVTSHP